MNQAIAVYPEVAAAAKWWADRMAADEFQDNGDGLQSGLATYARSLVDKLNPDERARFEAALVVSLQEHVSRGGWDRALVDQGWGSGCRTVGVDYGPDPALSAAEDAIASPDDRKTRARLSLLWPIKTTMWIDPGKVTVRHGYGAPFVVIYPALASE